MPERAREHGAGRPEPEHLVVGHVSKVHGTKGEVFVWPLTDRPDELFAEGRTVLLGDEEGAVAQDAPELTVERNRPFKRGQLVKFEGRDDRDAVTDLAGRYLVLPIGRVAALDEGEVFYHQLLGAEVVTVEGARVGRVREVFETEPNDGVNSGSFHVTQGTVYFFRLRSKEIAPAAYEVDLELV